MGYLDYVKYGKRLLIKQGSPLYVVFFITTKCNARCKHCLLGNQAVATTNDLSIDEIEKISASMDDFLFLLPTGGEPFIRTDIAEIVHIFHKNNRIRNVVIPTNGSLTDRVLGNVEKILQQNPKLTVGIDISIDGLGELHDQIRGVPGLFDTAVTTYRELRKLAKRYPQLNVNVESTVSSYNQDGLPELYNFLVNELGVSTIFTLLTRGKPKDPASIFVDVAKYEAYAARLENDIKNNVLTGYNNFPFCDVINAKRIVRNQVIARTAKENRYMLPCYAGRLGTAIFSNGEVYPCELLTDHKLGNLRECNYDFKELWSSPKAVEARKFICESKCFCTYECFMTLNILFNLKMWPQLFKEWAALKLAKSGKYSGRLS